MRGSKTKKFTGSSRSNPESMIAALDIQARGEFVRPMIVDVVLHPLPDSCDMGSLQHKLSRVPKF